MNPEFEVFQVGTHQSTKGEWLEFSEPELQKTCKAYDPDTHEAPLVLGSRQKHDDPAYGWAKGLRLSGGRMIASVAQLAPGFLDVSGGDYTRHLSSTFYRPYATSNPVPGVWYLRNVNYTGPEMRSADVRRVSFSESDDVVIVEFGIQARQVAFGEVATMNDAVAIAEAAVAFRDQRGKLGLFVTTTEAVNYVRGNSDTFTLIR